MMDHVIKVDFDIALAKKKKAMGNIFVYLNCYENVPRYFSRTFFYI